MRKLRPFTPDHTGAAFQQEPSVSDDATPRLNLPYLAAAQAQKHVTLNEALAALDGLVQTAVESRTVAAEPAAPPDGALYILPVARTLRVG